MATAAQQAPKRPAGYPDAGPQTYRTGFKPEPVKGGVVYQDLSYPDDYLQDPPMDVTDWLDDAMRRASLMRASDMTLDTNKNRTVLTIAIRIDGLMRPMYRVEGQAANRIMGVFKNNTNLASMAAFTPEESIRNLVVDGEMRKARVASFYKEDGGDHVVMRLPLTGPLMSLDQLSFSSQNLRLVRELLGSANRMVMLAGPMGSGKTTTAHGCLLELNTGGRTIWSIEDPVERSLPGVVQLAVNEEQQAGFDQLLPALVRADYNTLFLGEIRDAATASAGVRQSRAGRQIITTIHANDNVSAMQRLIELAGDSPRSVLDSVRGVVSQRLVARRNPDWNEGMDPVEKYLGRVPVHEVLMVTPEIVEAMSDDTVTLSEVREMALDSGDVSTFEADCERLVFDGVTDQEQVDEVFQGTFTRHTTVPKTNLVSAVQSLERTVLRAGQQAQDQRIESAVRAFAEEMGLGAGMQAGGGRRAAPVTHALPEPVQPWEGPAPTLDPVDNFDTFTRQATR